jgi:hypothetical protein
VKELSLTVRYEGGEADKGRLPIFDAGTAMHGLARSLNVVTHSFTNNGHLRKRGDGVKGATVFIQPPSKGCFEEVIDIEFGDSICKKVGGTVIVGHFWDYLLWCWSSAVGMQYEAKSSYVQKLLRDKDAKIYEIASYLESPMEELHKPISSDPNMTLTLARPHVGDQMVLDRNSLSYVSTLEETKETEIITGNATKFNVLSGFGRLYSDELQRTISFQTTSATTAAMRKQILSSMGDTIDDNGKKLKFRVTSVISAADQIKRYHVHGVYDS